MATPQEQRNLRLKNDYSEMLNIKGEVIQWKPIKGQAPYIEAYELSIKICTIISSTPSYRNEHVIIVELPDNYPLVSPQIRMQTTPFPYHPNWWDNGLWCYGSWDISETLGNHVVRMIRTLQFDKEITDENSPANRDANRWYVSKKTSGLFPCDRTNLPDPTQTKKFEILPSVKKKFSIQ